jgi:hypothetical protein
VFDKATDRASLLLARKEKTSMLAALGGRTALCVGLVVFVGVSVGGGAGQASASEARVLEQVSPVNKLGNPVKSPFAPVTALSATADGQSVMWTPGSAQGDDPGRGFGYPIVARRDDDRSWKSRNITSGPVPGVTLTVFNAPIRPVIPSADRTGILFASFSPFTADPDYPQAPAPGAPRQGIYAVRNGKTDWLSKPTWTGAVPSVDFGGLPAFLPVGASDDLGIAYFLALPTLTPGDQERNGDAVGLYRSRQGILEPADVLPDGSRSPNGATSAGAPYSPQGISLQFLVQDAVARPVSRDGRTTTFVTPGDESAPSTRRLYLSRVGRASVELSGDDGVGVVSATSSAYAMASEDGRYIVFQSGEALTPEAEADAAAPANKVYRYDSVTSRLEYLKDLGTDSGANIHAVSADGSAIFYRGQGGELALWRDGIGETRVADVADGVSSSRFSADGTALTLMSSSPLGVAFEHPEGTTQVYRVSSASGALACLSCATGATDAKFTNYLRQVGPGGNGAQASNAMSTDSRGISSDGRKVFFDTASQLIPGDPSRPSEPGKDHNSVSDVYEWSDGKLTLLSRGLRDGTASYYADSSESGDDVFIQTADDIGADDDGLYDVYDARVGGGVPVPPSRASCSEDACQGPSTPAPTLLQPTTPLHVPISRGRDRDTPNFRVTRIRWTGSRIVASLRVPEPGRVVATGARITRLSRVLKVPGTYSLRLKLRRSAQRSLRKTRRLRVAVRVQIAGGTTGAKTHTSRLTIRRLKR